MRQVKLTLQGPIGHRDVTDTYSEDSLLLTASGEVKPARLLREGDVLIRFVDGTIYAKEAQRWTLIQIEWMRKSERKWA